jgi:flagellar biosynthetic protein FliR
VEFEHINLGGYLLQNMDALWTFVLLTVRYGVLLTILPGLALSPSAKSLRAPAVLVLAFVSTQSSPLAHSPTQFGMLFAQVFSEAIFGLAMGLIPLMIISGLQMAGTLSSTTMGLGASQLVDPTLGGSVPALARLLGDLVTLVFLLSNTHHVVIYTASSMGGVLIPGTFSPSGPVVELIVSRVGEIFRLGALVASPVIVALMLTNFVMGLISKAIPQVNIFIVSFPLTIGIGLILSGLALPELIVVIQRELTVIDPSFLVIAGGLEHAPID